MLTGRNRRRWLVAAAILGCWVLLYAVTGSLIGATVLLVLFAAFCAACLVALGALGISPARLLARRGTGPPPAATGWTPVPPGNPARGAASEGQPPQGWAAPSPVAAGPPAWLAAPGQAPGPAPMAPGSGPAQLAAEPTATGLPTLAEQHRPAIPRLRLVSGDRVAQTWSSGARAGRGPVELVLPQVPTVSREHARFRFADGQWWVTNLGRNGLILNGVPVAGERAVCDGDVIRWGRSEDALVSRVQIG
jgi:hypothetical protein